MKHLYYRLSTWTLVPKYTSTFTCFYQFKKKMHHTNRPESIRSYHTIRVITTEFVGKLLGEMPSTCTDYWEWYVLEFPSKVMTSYSSNWFTLLSLCTSTLLVLRCDRSWFKTGKVWTGRPGTEDNDVSLCQWICISFFQSTIYIKHFLKCHFTKLTFDLVWPMTWVASCTVQSRR